MNLYIADTHFGHKNILLHDHRPFTDVEEMWVVMKELWNGRVDKNDDVSETTDSRMLVMTGILI